jgi:hypothetical protein
MAGTAGVFAPCPTLRMIEKTYQMIGGIKVKVISKPYDLIGETYFPQFYDLVGHYCPASSIYFFD